MRLRVNPLRLVSAAAGVVLVLPITPAPAQTRCPVVAGHLKAGKLRTLGISITQRVSVLPNVSAICKH